MDINSLLAFLLNSKELRRFKAGWWGRGAYSPEKGQKVAKRGARKQERGITLGKSLKRALVVLSTWTSVLVSEKHARLKTASILAQQGQWCTEGPWTWIRRLNLNLGTCRMGRGPVELQKTRRAPRSRILCPWARHSVMPRASFLICKAGLPHSPEFDERFRNLQHAGLFL